MFPENNIPHPNDPSTMATTSQNRIHILEEQVGHLRDMLQVASKTIREQQVNLKKVGHFLNSPSTVDSSITILVVDGVRTVIYVPRLEDPQEAIAASGSTLVEAILRVATKLNLAPTDLDCDIDPTY